MLYPLLENVLQTVCRKLQEDTGRGSFLASPWKSPEIAWGEYLDSICLMDEL
jgi:hypothetical protein